MDNTTSNSNADDTLLDINEAAILVRAPVATLRYWRHLGTGPRSFRVGRAVRYWRRDVQDWLLEQSNKSTPAKEGAALVHHD